MSVQTALLGGTAALSAMGSVMGANARAKAIGNQARQLEFQSLVQNRQAELQMFDAEVIRNDAYIQRTATAKFDVQKAGIALQGEELMLQTAQQEKIRREAIAQLVSDNAADFAARGLIGGPGSSESEIGVYNRTKGEADIAEIKRIGEGKKRYLDFSNTDVDVAKAFALIDAKGTELKAGNVEIAAGMTRMGAAASQRAASDTWASVAPTMAMGYMQAATTIGGAAYRMYG